MNTGWSSWRTLTASLIGVVAIIAPHLQALFDSNPATVCDWNIVIGTIVGLGGLGWFATDEQAAKDAGLPLK